MAAKKAKSTRAKAKTAAKKKTSKARGTKGMITKDSITFKLSPAEVKRAMACLERTGEIRYTFKKVRVTKLPQLLDDGKLID